jgi:hypothetical protein
MPKALVLARSHLINRFGNGAASRGCEKTHKCVHYRGRAVPQRRVKPPKSAWALVPVVAFCVYSKFFRNLLQLCPKEPSKDAVLASQVSPVSRSCRRGWRFVGLHPGNSAIHPKAHLPDLCPEVCSAWHGAWAVSTAWARREVNAHALGLHPRGNVGAEASLPPAERLRD